MKLIINKILKLTITIFFILIPNLLLAGWVQKTATNWENDSLFKDLKQVYYEHNTDEIITREESGFRIWDLESGNILEEYPLPQEYWHPMIYKKDHIYYYTDSTTLIRINRRSDRNDTLKNFIQYFEKQFLDLDPNYIHYTKGVTLYTFDISKDTIVHEVKFKNYFEIAIADYPKIIINESDYSSEGAEVKRWGYLFTIDLLNKNADTVVCGEFMQFNRYINLLSLRSQRSYKNNIEYVQRYYYTVNDDLSLDTIPQKYHGKEIFDYFGKDTLTVDRYSTNKINFNDSRFIELEDHIQLYHGNNNIDMIYSTIKHYPIDKKSYSLVLFDYKYGRIFEQILLDRTSENYFTYGDKIFLVTDKLIYYQFQHFNDNMQANFLYSSSEIIQGDSVFFEYYGNKEVDEYYWDFGDGAHSSERDPIHIYDSIGYFNVNLKVLYSNEWHSVLKDSIIHVKRSIDPQLQITNSKSIAPCDIRFTVTNPDTNVSYVWIIDGKEYNSHSISLHCEWGGPYYYQLKAFDNEHQTQEFGTHQVGFRELKELNSPRVNRINYYDYQPYLNNLLWFKDRYVLYFNKLVHYPKEHENDDEDFWMSKFIATINNQNLLVHKDLFNVYNSYDWLGHIYSNDSKIFITTTRLNKIKPVFYELNIDDPSVYQNGFIRDYYNFLVTNPIYFDNENLLVYSIGESSQKKEICLEMLLYNEDTLLDSYCTEFDRYDQEYYTNFKFKKIGNEVLSMNQIFDRVVIRKWSTANSKIVLEDSVAFDHPKRINDFIKIDKKYYVIDDNTLFEYSENGVVPLYSDEDFKLHSMIVGEKPLLISQKDSTINLVFFDDSFSNNGSITLNSIYGYVTQSNFLNNRYTIAGNIKNHNSNLGTGMFIIDFDDQFPNLSVNNSLNNTYTFPNPALDYIAFYDENTIGNNQKLLIYDNYGRIVIDIYNYNTGNKIDISNLSSGVYFIISNNKTYKFIKI